MIKAPTRAANGKTWCGPYALAAIAGITYEEAMANIKKVIKRRRIAGMYTWEVEAVARKRLGFKKFKWQVIPQKQRSTLVNSLDWLRPNRIYIVNVTGHYIVVNTKDWTFTDNNFGGAWCPITREARSGRRRCKMFAEAYRIPD